MPSVSRGTGPVMTNPSVQLIFWGAYWGGVISPTTLEIANALSAILAGPYPSRLTQYGSFTPVLAGVNVITSSSPAPGFTFLDVINLIYPLLGPTYPVPTAPGGANLYLVIVPPGLTMTSMGQHSFDTFIGPGGGNFWYAYVTWNGLLDDLTRIVSHEITEASVDPEGTGWQVDPRDPLNWHEICDVCAGTHVVGGYLVADYYSAADGVCVAPAQFPSALTRQIYDMITYDMLEDRQLRLGLVTDTQVVDYLNEAVNDFLRESGLIYRIWTQSISQGVGLYRVPDNFVRVDSVFVGGRFVPKSTQRELNARVRDWRRREGPTLAWYMDGLPPSTIGLAPAPNWNGSFIVGPHPPAPPAGQFDTFAPLVSLLPYTVPVPQDAVRQRNLSIVGPCTYSPDDSCGDTFLPLGSLYDPLPLVPEDFVRGFLEFSALDRIFASDAETKDNQKAMFCSAQFKEGLAVGKTVSGEPDEGDPQ